MCVGRKFTNNREFVPMKRPKSQHIKNHIKIRPLKPLFENNSEKLQYTEDVLAQFTYYTKIILFGIGDCYKSFLNSALYKILFHTTQPAHLITALSVIILAFLMMPQKTETHQLAPAWNLIYLGAFCTHFGTQIWMTFVSGLALYFSLPRHIFGNIQQVLFPKYFLMNTTLSLITLTIFLRNKNRQLGTSEIAIQAAGLSLCFLTELIIRLYLCGPLLGLIKMKNQMEIEAGVGMEVGKLDPGKLLHCPHYIKIHKTFRKYHMSIAIGNIITLACSVLHLYYLSHKLCFL